MQLLGWGVPWDIFFSRELDCLLRTFAKYTEALRFTNLSMLELGDSELIEMRQVVLQSKLALRRVLFNWYTFLNGVLGVYQVLEYLTNRPFLALS